MSKYVIKFEDNPWYQDEGVGYYKCGEIPWWSAKKSDIKKLTPLDKELDEAYKRGLDDGKARNENGCVGCKYDNERIDHAPCIYCCNAYSNQWMAKEKSDEIKVGDEVESLCTGNTFIIHEINENCVKGYNFNSRVTCYSEKNNFKKTGRHFPQMKELIEAMKEDGE